MNRAAALHGPRDLRLEQRPVPKPAAHEVLLEVLRFVDGETLVDAIEEFLTGSRRTADPNRVLATVLFTDIVDSTSRLAALGDKRWHELMERHDALVRRATDRFHGKQINTTGDGFLMTFEGPGRAVRAAAATIREAHALGLGIRAGLHTGECELVGADVQGLAVHVGARVAALAGADEILMTGNVRDLLVEPELELADLGRHALRGVPGEWRLFRLERTGRTGVDLCA